jgi:hypothetical protein
MEVFRNERKVRINREIGRWATLGGLVVLIAGMVISLRSPSIPFLGSSGGDGPRGFDTMWISLASLVIGFFASAVGAYYANHWTRSPRPDEALDAALKGISNHYHIYHYLLPVSHVLLGPAGVFTFRTFTQEGPVSYDGKRWRQKFSILRALGFSGQESLVDPVRDALHDVQRLRRWLAQRLPEEELPEITPFVVFVRDEVELDVVETEVPVLHYKRLKRAIRQIDKERNDPLDNDTLYDLERALLGDRVDVL